MTMDIILLIIIGGAVVLSIMFLVHRHKKCSSCPYSNCEYHKTNHNFSCKGCKGEKNV